MCCSEEKAKLSARNGYGHSSEVAKQEMEARGGSYYLEGKQEVEAGG